MCENVAKTVEAKVVNVVEVLICDVVLVERWKKFCDALELSPWIKPTLATKVIMTLMDIPQLFQKLLNEWISKCGAEATVQHLINILIEAGFKNAADNLEDTYYDTKLEGANSLVKLNYLTGLKIRYSGSVGAWRRMSSSKKGWVIAGVVLIFLVTLAGVIAGSIIWLKRGGSNKLRIWHGNMPSPSPHFQGRENELKAMNHCLQIHLKSGQARGILITGPPLIGKSELARHFSDNLYRHQGFNLFWINGKNLSAEVNEFKDFIKEIRINMTLSLSQMCEGLDPWLILFDHVDTNDWTALKNLLTDNSIYPPECRPFIIVTSNRDEINNTLSHKSFIKFCDQIPLQNYSSLSRMFKHELTSWVKDSERSMRMEVKLPESELTSVCDRIDATFANLEERNLTSILATKLSFSLLALMGHFVVGEVTEYFLVKFWTLSIHEKRLEDSLALQLQVLQSFSNGHLITYKDSKGLVMSFSSPEASSLIKNFYLIHPELKDLYFKWFGFDPEKEPSVLEWLMVTLNRFWRIPPASRTNFKEVTHVSNLVEKVLAHDELVRKFKDEIVEIGRQKNVVTGRLYFEVELAQKVFYTYTRVFGNNSLETLAVGKEVAENLSLSRKYKESGILYRELYVMMKEVYGPFAPPTSDSGDEAIKNFNWQGMFDEAIDVAEEMVLTCLDKLDDNDLLCLRSRYTKGPSWERLDPPTAINTYQHILNNLNQGGMSHSYLVTWVNERLEILKRIS